MTDTPRLFTPVLLVSCAIILVSFAIRGSFGVFQIPIAEEFGWLRSEFSLAIALQNLFWGIGQPFFAALAEKTGDRVAIVLGGVLYAAGLVAVVLVLHRVAWRILARLRAGPDMQAPGGPGPEDVA